METPKTSNKYYEAVIWLLLTDYIDGVYTPSQFLLETTKPKLEQASNETPIVIYDSTLFDFRLVTGFKNYLDMFLKGTEKFETALVILSYSCDKHIPRDYYLANLTKQYTCWDTAYIDCPNKARVTTSVFDFILSPTELPTKLKEIINRKV